MFSLRIIYVYAFVLKTMYIVVLPQTLIEVVYRKKCDMLPHVDMDVMMSDLVLFCYAPFYKGPVWGR